MQVKLRYHEQQSKLHINDLWYILRSTKLVQAIQHLDNTTNKNMKSNDKSG